MTVENTKEKSVYEIKLDGRTVLTSSMPMCGYSRDVLRRIMAAGYRYCANGKIQRKIE